MTEGAAGSSAGDRFALYDLFAAYGALIANFCGFGGVRLVESRWLDVLDRPVEDRIALLRQAEGLGLARVRSVGDVFEVDVRGPLGRTLEVPELVER